MSNQLKNYIIEESAKYGNFGQRDFGRNSTTGQPVLIKKYDRKFIESSGILNNHFQNEIEYLMMYRNDNIPQCIDVVVNQTNLYLVYQKSDSFLTFLQKQGNMILDQEQALKIFRQIVNGFHYYRQNNKSLRDFTIENILIYKNYEGENTILIDDFGIISILNSIATKIEYKSPYMSPELLKGSYYQDKSEVFSLGMILHRILFGCLPWISSSSEIFLEKISKQPLKFPLEINQISQETQLFLLSMLNIDVSQRINFDQLLQHQVILQQRLERMSQLKSMCTFFHKNIPK